ncbi:hypothetical protein [Cellulosimicrobium sp. SL-1]|uniref:hypothetical protein n=1 Tax=Cellulosimicrobium sp. SL-1 TaxID=2699423 RepID=UPI0013D37546|nr:hypothetical protein [Cellulosimicrobium sp. SL-1]
MDTFGDRVTVYVNDKTGTPWEVAEFLLERIMRGLRELPGTIEVSASASAGGTSLDRPTPREAADALLAHDVTPTASRVSIVNRNSEVTGSWLPVVEVSVSANSDLRGGHVDRFLVSANVESRTKIVADGLLARVNAALEALQKNGVTVETVEEAARRAAIEARIGKHTVTEATIVAPVAATSSAQPVAKTEPGWWKRTWREHAAALVIGLVVTIAGTIAAAYALVQFGLGSGGGN